VVVVVVAAVVMMLLRQLDQMLHFVVVMIISLKIKELSRKELEYVRSGVRFTPVHGLATSGEVYSRTRNPLYLVVVWIMTALSVLVNSWWFLVASALFWSYAQFWVIPVEERFLKERFGKKYDEYCHKTPRWL
jgi:protein-S-isoprenylcysteine O-methyltransferase Ste14